VRSVFERVRERGGFSQVFDAQKLVGLARTSPCRVARARAKTLAATAAKRPCPLGTKKEVTSMIKVQNLTKRYGGKHLALDNVSFTINKGEIVGLLGPNGAGKSTTMNIITGYIAASGGTAIVDGLDISEQPIEAKKKIGYLPEQPPLYMEMTVTEYLKFVCELKKAKIEDKKKYLTNIMGLVGINEVSGRVIKNLSKGYKQRVGLAAALCGDPEVLIFDEPTVGLDPNQIIEIRNVIKDLGKERTVILSTHILHEVEEICDRIIIINKGKIVADVKMSELDDSLENIFIKLTMADMLGEVKA